ncbi:hypothetical protein [Phocaeicola sartorii]|uniref:hypothetical protein n=1 Tax=Phocaeicola sartorii TaxID=671267 RepID=UPI001F593F0E|nr:hypothetical protein [Phocaeicola sartorii]
MKFKFMVAATLMAALVTITSCGNSNNKQSQSEKTEQAAPEVLSVDNLLVHADSLVNREVTIEGICTHTCKHGATKIFLMGSDDTKTIRVEAGPLGSFDTKCINAIVIVTGTLKEQRVDEAYLQNWEAKLKAQTEKSHGETAAGCDSEKKARGETANTPEARIADFRAKIAERKTAAGKDYLSFYYMEASSYEIAE